MHIGVFILLLLSGERNFGVRLNKPYTATVPMDIPVFPFRNKPFVRKSDTTLNAAPVKLDIDDEVEVELEEEEVSDGDKSENSEICMTTG